MRLRKNISLMLALFLVLPLFSCGASVPELVNKHEGKYLTINYPELWEVIEEEYSTKLVFEGVMLQFDAIENENSELGNTNKIKSFIDAKLEGYDVLEENDIELKIDSSDDLCSSKIYRTGDGNKGAGIIMFTPVNDAIYISQLQPGKYKKVELQTTDAIFNNTVIKLTGWFIEEQPPVQWTVQTYDQGFWSFDYHSNWEIEKIDNDIRFLDSNGAELIQINKVGSDKFDPEDKSYVSSYLKDLHGKSVGKQSPAGSLIQFDGLENNYFLVTNGELFTIFLSPDLGEESIAEIVASFKYISDKDPGKTSDESNTPDENNNNQNTGNKGGSIDTDPIDNPVVKKGDVTNNEKFKIVLPSGWNFEEVSEMTYFINPPDKNGSFIVIEVQPALSFAGMSERDIYEIFKADLGDVTAPKNVKLGTHDALQYTIKEDGKSQIFTTHINNNFYYTVKLIIGDKNYSNEYTAFLEWFETK